MHCRCVSERNARATPRRATLGALLWSVAVVMLGYFLGTSWQLAER
jgi:hypothetical protein